MLTYLLLVVTLFCVGSFGIFVVRKHIIISLIALELLLLAINLNFIIASMYMEDAVGQVVALIVLCVAAAETSIGLALLIVFYRLRGGISLDLISLLKS